MKPITAFFILLVIAALLYFLLKTQIETLFKQLKAGNTAPSNPNQTQTTNNNNPNNNGNITYNNAADLNCPITDVDFKKMLFKGMPKNKEVSYLQCLLNLRGSNLTVDGVFGSKTEAAVAQHLKIALPVPPINLESISAIK